MAEVLDWRALAPDPDPHACGCDLCPHDGGLEPQYWWPLTTTSVEYVPAVTDGYLLVQAALAPVPEGYEGEVREGPHRMRTAYLKTPATAQPATGLHFRWPTMKAIELTGWRLRLLDHPADATKHTRRMVAVVNAEGSVIGWAISSDPVEEDAFTLVATREYVE